MNKFLVFSSILAIAFARPTELAGDADGHVSVVQNSIGTYKYNVLLKDSSRTEERFADGSVVGEYTSIDAHGIPRTFKYSAGKNGFQILEGPVPVAPVDHGVAPSPVAETPEVIAARSNFFVADHHTVSPSTFAPAPVHAAPVALLLPVASSGSFTPVAAHHGLVLPVEDTPEVKAAKAEFFHAFNKASFA